MSKGTGFIKEEHKFQATNTETKRETNFLNFEESDNLQDMINFAASMNQSERTQSIYPIESLYAKALNNIQSTSHHYTNEHLDNSIADILKRYIYK
jgi:hypothetical protein